MYLNPPCNDLQELAERIDNQEIFRVYKRQVNERTMDRTFKKYGRSRVVLGNGTTVIVTIFSGKVQFAHLLVDIPTEIDGHARTLEIPPQPTKQGKFFRRNPEDDQTFAKFLKYSKDLESNYKKPSN